MESTPPQAPPAVVSTTQQETVDGLARLNATHRWLESQQQALPEIPADRSPAHREAFVASLKAFWRGGVATDPGTAPIPRVDALAAHIAAVMRDDAIVRGLDGTLGSRAAALAARFARSSVGGLPPGIEVRALRVGDVDYAGAVVVHDASDPGLFLRFLPDHGWDAYNDLESLHAQTENEWRERLAYRRTLPGVRADDTQRVIAEMRFVQSVPVEGDVFQVLARGVVALQRACVKDAWPVDAQGIAPGELTDALSAALDLHGKIDIVALLAEREHRLASAADEQRMAGVPQDVAQGWRAAIASYRLASLQAHAAARQDGEAPLTLAAWVRKELTGELSRRGFPSDPDDIQIDVRGTEELALPSLGTAASVPVTRMGLAEFALRNVGYFDARSLEVVAAGLPPGARIPDAQALREIARKLNLAPRFEAYLRDRVRDPEGRTFRTATMRLQQARMRVEATAARASTYIRDEPAVFLDDHEDRGYKMVEAVLDAPIAVVRPTVGGHRIVVRQLMYRGAAVSDVLVIGVRDPRSSSRVVIYTPGAPDGRNFHEFSDRATAARQLLYAPAFASYLIDRLPAEFSEMAANGSGRRFRVSEATRRSQWVLAAPSDGRGTLTEERFEERDVNGDVRTALFDAEISRQARDVAWIGRSTSRADAASIMGTLGVALGALRGPEALVEESLGAVGQALRATWRFYDSVKAKDSDQAFVDFTDAYTASLSLAGWGGGLFRAGTPRLSLKPTPGTSRLTDSGIRAAAPGRWLEPRYATQGIDLAGVPADARGIHRLGGRRYIRQQERIFEVRHDPATDTWRLVRPNALDATFAGPAVEAMGNGGWRVRTDIGLRGGWADRPAFPHPATRTVVGTELAGLTEFQRWSFEQEFRQRLRNGGEAALIHWEATSQPTPRIVTLRQRMAWDDALRVARAAPPEPLPVGTPPPAGASWRVLPQAEWPTSLWCEPPIGIVGSLGADGSVILPLRAVAGSGLTGVATTAQTPVRTSGMLQLHLDPFRGRLGTIESPALRIIEDRRGSVPTYVVQPDSGFPLNFLGLETGEFTAYSRAPSPPPSP